MRRITDGAHASCNAPTSADCIRAAAAERGSACDAALTYTCANTTYTRAGTTDAYAGATDTCADTTDTATRADASREDDPPRQRNVIALVSWRDVRLA